MSGAARAIAIPDGTDLVEALRLAIGAADGWVQAVGHVEGVELRVAGAGVDPTRTVRGRVTLVSFGGPAGGPYLATLARHADGGFELFGGALLRARTSGVTAVLLPFFPTPTRAVAEPGDDEPPLEDRTRAPGSVPSAAHPPLGPEPNAWAALAQASAEAALADEPSPEEIPSPERGDRVQHFAFGLCDVLMSDGDSLRIRDVARTGRIREIRLEKLIVLAPTIRDGKRVFKLVRSDGRDPSADRTRPPGSGQG